MASRLPLELWHDIILLNDDAVHGYRQTPWDMSRQSGYHNGYIESRAKSCARAVALVCSRWHRFVRASPRLWLRRLSITSMVHGTCIVGGFRTQSLEQILSRASSEISSNSDIDIGITAYAAESLGDIFVDGLFAFLRSTTSHWRVVCIMFDTMTFNRAWLKLLEEVSVYPRLRHLTTKGSNMGVFGQALCFPSLLDLDITTRTLPRQVGDAFDRIHHLHLEGTEVADNVNVADWIKSLIHIPNLHLIIRKGVQESLTQLSTCDTKTFNTETRARQVSVQGARQVILETLATLPMSIIEELDITVDSSSILERGPWDVSTHYTFCILARLNIVVADDHELRKITSIMDLSNLQEMSIKLRAPSPPAHISFTSSFPKLLRLRLSLSGSEVNFGFMDVPLLKEIIFNGILAFGYLRPEFSIGQEKVTLKEVSTVKIDGYLQSFSVLRDLDLPALKAIHMSPGHSHFARSDLKPVMETVKHHLSGIEEFHVPVPKQWTVLRTLMGPMSNLVTLHFLFHSDQANLQAMSILRQTKSGKVRFPKLLHLRMTAEKYGQDILEKLCEIVKERNNTRFLLKTISLEGWGFRCIALRPLQDIITEDTTLIAVGNQY